MKNITIKETTPLVSKSEALIIGDDQSLKEATELLSSLNQMLNKVVESRETITKPLNEALKQARLKYKPIESSLESAVSIIRQKMSEYATKIENARLKKVSEIENNLEDGKITAKTALSKLEKLNNVPDTVTTTQGSVSFRQSYKLKIIDESVIPRKYLVVDESSVLKDLKAGIKVAGCELEMVQVVVNKI